MNNKRLPVISNNRRICIICEGNEEVEYLEKLNELDVWNKQYDVILENAEGNGNIAARYQNAYQNEEYDAIFAFVDTDRRPYDQYIDIKTKIDDIFGIDNASDEVVVFGNPCTMQIMIMHFDDVMIPSHLKWKNAPIIEKYTGIKQYNATKEKRKEFFQFISKENYFEMKERIKTLSTNDKEKNSTNFNKLLEYLSSKDDIWIEELNRKLDY